MMNSLRYRADTNKRLPGTGGFTLLECMVSLVLLSLIMGALFAIMTTSQDSQERGCQAADARQNLRSAFEVMARDIRAAGSGFGSLAVSACYSGQEFPIYAVNPDTISPGLTLVGVMDSTVTILSTRMQYSTSDPRCVDVSKFQVGDLIVITDDITAHMFQVTDVDGNQSVLRTDPTSPYNPPSGFSDWPPSGYAEDSRVQKVSMVTYYRDADQLALMRETPDEGPSYVAGGVTSLQILYYLAEGDSTHNPPDLTQVAAISMTMAAQSDQLRSGDYSTQVLTTTLVPRCLGR